MDQAPCDPVAGGFFLMGILKGIECGKEPATAATKRGGSLPGIRVNTGASPLSRLQPERRGKSRQRFGGLISADLGGGQICRSPAAPRPTKGAAPCDLVTGLFLDGGGQLVFNSCHAIKNFNQKAARTNIQREIQNARFHQQSSNCLGRVRHSRGVEQRRARSKKIRHRRH
jgi:hypothetical protein